MVHRPHSVCLQSSLNEQAIYAFTLVDALSLLKSKRMKSAGAQVQTLASFLAFTRRAKFGTKMDRFGRLSLSGFVTDDQPGCCVLRRSNLGTGTCFSGNAG